MRRSIFIGGAAAAAWSLPALAPIVRPVAHALGVPRRMEWRDAVAVTFDDGPHPEGTPAVLEALAAAGARATFFLVGEQVERNPALAAEVSAAGHGIESHGYRHISQLRRSPADLRDDLSRAHDVIADRTGRAPQLYRPPYGVFSWTGLSAVRKHWSPLLWSRWGRDWSARATPESIAAKVTDGLAGGDVLLLHDADTYSAPGSHRRTAAALPRVLEAVASRGLRAEPVYERSATVDLPQPVNPREFEEACLAALAEELRVQSTYPSTLFEFRDAWLEGSYPDTEVVIRYFDRRSQWESVDRESLWSIREAMDSELPDETAIWIAVQFRENY